jgi:hypothetical protein
MTHRGDDYAESALDGAQLSLVRELERDARLGNVELASTVVSGGASGK